MDVLFDPCHPGGTVGVGAHPLERDPGRRLSSLACRLIGLVSERGRERADERGEDGEEDREHADQLGQSDPTLIAHEPGCGTTDRHGLDIGGCDLVRLPPTGEGAAWRRRRPCDGPPAPAFTDDARGGARSTRTVDRTAVAVVYRDHVSQLVSDLIAIASIPAPTDGEEARLRWLEGRLADAAGTRERDEAGNLVWRIGEGRPALAVLAHVDTVFAASLDHVPRERDGWLHGPGIGDNAAAVAVTVAAVEEVASHLRLPLAVVFTVGEEGLGNLRGARHACRLLQPEAVIALEGHGLEKVCIDAVGSVRTRLVVTGPGGHSWWDRGRPSAISSLVSLLHDLPALAHDGLALNVGTITGGEAVNAIAARAEAVVEGRSLDEEALTSFEVAIGRLAVSPPLSLEREPLGHRPCGRLDRSHPLLAATRAVRAAIGLPDHLGDGSTDANAALALGIPAIALGCARGHDMHAPSERIEIASLALGRAQLVAIVDRLVGSGRAD